jgi:hypothetical protein
LKNRSVRDAHKTVYRVVENLFACHIFFKHRSPQIFSPLYKTLFYSILRFG